jgi:methyltransferase (TIGR00027 family)
MTDRGSQTADVMALFRALETLGRHANGCSRIRTRKAFCHRPDACYCCWPACTLIRRRIHRILDHKWPGARTSAVARTRLADDLLQDALRNGARQVLILGAGFDMRAYRSPDITTAQVFEVDHPFTQAAKIRLVGAEPSTLAL